jgi:hypothetical protein
MVTVPVSPVSHINLLMWNANIVTLLHPFTDILLNIIIIIIQKSESIYSADQPAWYFNAIGCHGGRVVFALESGPLDRMFARFIGLGKVEERRPSLSDIASIGKLFTDSNPI